MCLPSDALLQHLPSHLGLSYLGRGVSLHGCSSKAQPLLLTLDEGYLLTAAPPDLGGVAPLGPPAPTQQPLLRGGVAPLSCSPWPWTWGSSSAQLLRCRSLALSVATPDLGRGVAPHSRASRGASARSVASVIYLSPPHNCGRFYSLAETAYRSDLVWEIRQKKTHI